MMYNFLIPKRLMVKVLLSIMAIGIFSSCSKTEQYASATINGIEYAEIRNSEALFESPPSSIMIFQDSKVALYRTSLKPLTGDHPSFRIDFWLSLKENSELEINKVYKILGKKVSKEYEWRSTITQLKEDLSNDYDGIVYCHKEGVDESFLLEGTFELKKYEGNTGYYYGSYMLINSSEENEILNIKGDFKFFEFKSQLDN